MADPETHRRQTWVKRLPTGRYLAECRVCPRRTWQAFQLDERLPKQFDTGQEAAEQGRRHRKASAHLAVVAALASTEPSNEERKIYSAFGVALPGPCAQCGHHHSTKLSCQQAADVRDRESSR